MTFSIVAREPDGSALAVAVASRFLAAGAAVPAARAGVGALATQALANLRYRADGLDLLAAGADAQQVVNALTAADDMRDHRQLGVICMDGDGANWTGSACLAWAGGHAGPGFTVQGNILTGPQVIQAMVASWEGLAGEPLPRRLLGSLLAGDRAGGDRRGRQSAAMLVVSPAGGYGHGSDVLVDLRVDDHADPVPELARLVDLHELYFGRPDPADCLPLTGEVAVEVAALLARTGHPTSPADPGGIERSLLAWAGMENLEERLVPGRIDPAVLRQLRLVGAVNGDPR